jgi:SAM-dependent methyltransferase
MSSFIKKVYIVSIVRPLAKVDLITNKFSRKKQCYICKTEFGHFTKHRGGTKYVPDFFKRLNLVGSDIDNFRCMYCKAHDRERHLFMFFDKLNLWDKFKNGNVLHFAAEKNLSLTIQKLSPATYIKADLYPKDNTITKMDATNIPNADNYFDVVICNHVMEHIPDYKKAMSEIFRVLKLGGTAILQAPYSTLLKENFEVKETDTDEFRNFFYGQRDHVRIFSERRYFDALKSIGFRLEIAKNSDYFSDKECIRFGVNKMEDLVRVVKPS